MEQDSNDALAYGVSNEDDLSFMLDSVAYECLPKALKRFCQSSLDGGKLVFLFLYFICRVRVSWDFPAECCTAELSATCLCTRFNVCDHWLPGNFIDARLSDM